MADAELADAELADGMAASGRQSSQLQGESAKEESQEKGSVEESTAREGEVNVRPWSQQPCWIKKEHWQYLVGRKSSSWSVCKTEEEWLAKLHYLRMGYQAGKLDEQRFYERELRLVRSWLTRAGARARR